MSDLDILLTNDDGIDAPGIAAIREELAALGDVTVVAPADNQSGVGRTRNHRAVLSEHPWGHALAGTPADCAAYGLRGLDTEFDLVVSGINDGPNAGNYVVGRSGTVGAGIEAAFLGTPAIAVSAYHASEFFLAEEHDFDRPARIARRLAERAMDADLFSEVDLLNVNAPVDVENPRLRVTRPLADYDQDVEHADEVPEDVDLGDGDRLIRLRDRTWPDVVGYESPFPPTEDYRDRYPLGSDRRALVDGEVGVSPLSVNHGHAESEALADVLESMDAG